MLALIGALLYLTGCVGVGYAIGPSVGFVVLSLILGTFLVMLLTYNHWTTKIDYTKIVDSRPVYKRGHRYAGQSLHWPSGDVSSHFPYGRWQVGTEVRFEIHYLPCRKKRKRLMRAEVGTWMYDRCIVKLDEHRVEKLEPPAEKKPTRHPILRFLGYLVAVPLAFVAIGVVLVSILTTDYFMIWFGLILMIPAIVIFALTQSVK